MLVITVDNFLENYDSLVGIIKNSPEYQKLADCTQMIFDKKGNNKVHNRQTHTERVAKLASGLAKKFGLSDYEQKLAELIGICHDLGHTAFGHTGESRVDKVLGYFNISSQEFNNSYVKKNNTPEIVEGLGKYQEMDHSFEHHAHSTRVLRKILKDNDVVIEDELMDDLEWGILCHSESRVHDDKVSKKLWTLARYADKFYAFTDVYDTIKSENYIPGDILYRIKSDKNAMKYFPNDFELTQEDLNQFTGILEVFEQGDAIKFFSQRYVEEAVIENENGYYYIQTKSNNNIGRQMRILQGVMKYMRDRGFIGKEEKLANAMIDEIIAYKIAHPDEGIDSERDKIINACMFVTMTTDSELRDFYRLISHDMAWTNEFDEKMKTNREFETEISPSERGYIRKNPEMILNYYFNTEIKKVKNEGVRNLLYSKLIEYRTTPTLEARRNLINLIEIAQVGGDPFSKGVDR